jgi:hypothetical protein
VSDLIADRHQPRERLPESHHQRYQAELLLRGWDLGGEVSQSRRRAYYQVMPTLECHGCERPIEESEAKWVKPFDDVPTRTDAAGNILETYSSVYSEPVPGAEPYCATCLRKLMQNATRP